MPPDRQPRPLLTVTLLLLLVALLPASPAAAADDPDAEAAPWQELDVALPESPEAARWLPFEVGPAARHSHFLDPASLRADSDGVVRYTVRVRSAGGAENVAFEGMRCATGESKIYAFGRPDGSWSRNTRARWEPIQVRRADAFRRELFYHYFCTVDGAADLRVIQRALKAGGIRRGGD